MSPPDGAGTERIRRTIDEAEEVKPESPQPSYISFGRYRMSDKGLFFDEPDGSDNPPTWLSAPFEVLVHTRDAYSDAWGKLLRWHDLDGRAHEWAMPEKALAGRHEEVLRMLLDGGLQIASSTASRNKLAGYLSAVKVTGRARAASRIGWHVEGDSVVFVLPDVTYGEPPGQRVLLQTEVRAETRYAVAGTVEDWRDQVGARCIGNSRLVLGISTAFAAPVLQLANEENGGVHFVGSSRLGKTTILRVAGSVWGGGGVNGYLRSWRATSNGLEAVAEAHCDTLLCLDEMGQVDAREAGEVAYMMANGRARVEPDEMAQPGNRRNGDCSSSPAARFLSLTRWPRSAGDRRPARRFGLSISLRTRGKDWAPSRTCMAPHPRAHSQSSCG